MAQCETCGLEYDRAMEIILDGRTLRFDIFECAIHRLVPRCGHCGCRVIGHGDQADDSIFCFDHRVREHESPALTRG